MGIDNAFLRELPGFLFLLVGFFSQIYLFRTFAVRRSVMRAVLAVQFVIFLANNDPFFYFIARNLPLGVKTEPLAGAVTLLWWAVTPIAIVVWFRRRLSTNHFSPARRAVLRTSLSAVAAAPAIALGAGIITRKDFQVNEVSIKFPNLPKDLQGLRLVQLSDIHMSSYYSRADFSRAVDAANQLRAHLMLVTGDLITDRFDPLDDCLLELKRLRSANGIWGCLGNHEMHAKAESYTAHKAQQLDIHFLRHQNAPLTFGTSKLNLVGVDHQKRNRPYLQKVGPLVASDAFNLLLSHNPDVFPVSAQLGFDLTLSGHTHGGQINLEVLGTNINIADVVTPFTKGLYQRDKSTLYVNAGLGTIGVPVRLGSPAEITVITLCNS